MELPLVTIILVNWNGKEDTLACLRSLSAVDYPGVTFEVDPNALEAARAALSDRYWAARTRSRALGRVLDGLDGLGG